MSDKANKRQWVFYVVPVYVRTPGRPLVKMKVLWHPGLALVFFPFLDFGLILVC